MRAVAARRGIGFGLAVRPDLLRGDPAYAAAAAREAALLVPEGATKWWNLRPAEDRLDSSEVDVITGFAARHGQAVRGHTLVWHDALRPWALAALEEGPARARALLEAHLDRVLAHTAAAIRDWDVANEAVADPGGGSSDLLKDTPWLRALGPGYLDLAFRLARARDPGLTLTYNDYGCENGTPRGEEKRRRVLALARGFRDRGVPVDAVGMQGHLPLAVPFDAAAVTRFVRDLRALDLAVPVTELDVIEPEIDGGAGPADAAARDAAAALRVHAFLSAVLEGGGGRAVLCWGVADHASWANVPAGPGAADRRPPGWRARPLPLDERYARKPMWHAIAAAFAGRPWPG